MSHKEGASHARFALRHWSQERFWRLILAVDGNGRDRGRSAGAGDSRGAVFKKINCNLVNELVFEWK
jgi:hypothetical protein